MKKKGKKSSNDSLKSMYLSSLRLLNSAKHYIFAVFLVLFFCSVIGFFFPFIFQEEINNIVEKMIAELDGMGPLELTLHIFFNNLQASITSLLFGIVLGVFPIFAALFNGYIIGFVSRLAVDRSDIFALWRLLPHGIFEIPAVIISMGIGIYLGGKFLEHRFHIKSTLKKLSIIFLISIILIPIGVLSFISGQEAMELSRGDMFSLSFSGWILILSVNLINLLLLFCLIYVFFYFFKEKQLRKALIESLWAFVLIIFPLLLIAAIIEGALIALTMS